mmetsp:Transcript_16362/g.46982  ORF Transcript_16362/g.46982 Transcript_16362/m.46982 type:complete len:1615 (+) Transcript_16362:70-4914(+)|eukprot:CAMPEP_0181034520 /NCGR_PEP_ID=MMETSP1070-20121207/7856_1 /TAXON_ID=265543 /ORGANISM="Minutocellus polymorphus, Strain NH13" /LENGTH=1614 /DNA_ID=CAMNT_0023112063 /DNA_START=60 /DNA_END=4904 /DNA_ORIENTATION=-
MSGEEGGGGPAASAAAAEAGLDRSAADRPASTSAPQDGVHDGATNNSEGGGALVKNLLFPSYTAAGSNEAFQSLGGDDDANNNNHEADTKGTNHVDESMLTHTGAGSLNQSLTSDVGDGHDVSMVNSSTAADGGALSPLPPRGSPLVPPTPDADADADGVGSGGILFPADVAAADSAGDMTSSAEAEDAPGVKSPPKMMRKTTPRLRPPTASVASSGLAMAGRLGTNTGTNGSPDRASASTMHSGASSGILGTKFLSDVSSSSSRQQQQQQHHEVSSTVSTEVVGNLSQGNAAAAEVSSTGSTNVMHNLSGGVGASELHHEGGGVGSTDSGGKVLHLSAENLEKISPPKMASKLPFHRGEGDDDGDNTSETNSMTSHMGSEPGDRKLRLEDVARMEVMAEGDEDEAEDDSGELVMPVLSPSRSIPEQHPKQARPTRTISTSANVGEPDTTPMSSNGSHGMDNAPSKSFLSNAIHRIGSGVSQSIAGRGTPSGAPPTPKTPRSPHPSPRGESGPQLSASISAMLRSPRLSNHGDASGTRNAVLSPRFSSLSSPYRKTSPAGSHHSAASVRSGMSGAPPPPAAPQNLILSPFQRARGCMSFDSSDGVGAVPGGSPPPSPSMGMRGRKTYIQHRSSARSPRQSLQQRSRSWDAESEYRYIDGAARLYGRHESGPVRQQQARKYPPSPRQLTGISSASAGNAFRSGGSITYDRRTSGGSDDMHKHPQQVSQRPKRDDVPQRIEIEREDAINLLTCLVERSIAFHDKSDLDTPNASKANKSTSKEEDQVERSSSFSDTTEALESLRIISKEYNEKQQISKDDASSDVASGDAAVGADHATRMKALDELLHSQTYAVEMQRAAFSASSWLKAIGRSDTGSEDNQMHISYSYSHSSTGADEEKKTKTEDATAEENGTDQNKKLVGDVAKMDVIALRAQLHAAEAKASEKSEYTKRLDEELAKCRAEIGRLKSTSRTEALFSSPNKSIFDVEEEDGSSSSDSETEPEEASEIAPKQLESALKDVSAVIDEDESSQAGDATVTKSNTNTTEVDSYVKEILLLKAALGEANTRLCKFEEGNGNAADSNTCTDPEDDAGSKVEDVVETGDIGPGGGSERSNDEDLDTSVIPANLSNFFLEKDLETYRDAIRTAASAEIETLNEELEALKSAVASQTSPPAKSHPKNSPGNKEERMINARMLNAEDFVTEWDPITQLPPPPDHPLRSPIVYELLSQWSSDQVMQESLLGWVENIMAGEDPSNVPPLKISSLNHQLRDGFVMHILPLLLRRPDIHVEVTTRAHRRTSYDMAVSITKPMPDRNGAASFGNIGGTGDGAPALNGSVPRRSAPSNKHMLAFKASRGGISEEAEDDTEGKRDIQQHVRSKVSEYLRGGNISSTDVGTGSVANASDVTNRISNLASVAKLAPRTSHDTAPLSGSPSADEFSTATGGSGSLRVVQQQKSSQEQPGLVGRAMGLLSRRKDEGQSDRPPRDIRLPPSGSSSSRLQMPSLTASDDGGHGLVYATQEEEEQYHRVVSVPPGKIGITFVQYRGHAMVSDVSPDSPLNGWIFPSDIVIAVDEKAVSGLRVREIVDLLKSRKDRQRALRVISSHDLQDIVAQEAPTALLG